MADFINAVMLLTRLPISRWARGTDPRDLARCVWAFPLVGFVVNGIGGLVYWLAHRLGMSPLLAAAWALAATVIMTGALHEDGLADVADGFGGGVTPASKMEIMRDSRLGTYGALAVLLAMIMRVGAFTALGRPAIVATSMILAGMLGRAAMILLLLVLKPARGDGLGAAMGRPGARRAVLGLGLGLAAAFFLVPPQTATLTVALGLAAALLFAKLAFSQIGGFTGDVLGAGEVIAECVVLTSMACAFGG